jgi:amidase
MGSTAGGTDTPAQTQDTTTGNVRAEGWMQYIDRHPELAAQGFKITTSVAVDCSQKKVAYVRADAATCSTTPPPRMTPAEIKAKRDYRVSRQAAVKTWMDNAGVDHRGVDAIVYPGLLSEISVNDGGGGRPSFGRRDTPSAANGVPTVAFPVGFDDHGQPVNIQILGRAWDDAKLVGLAYAFEHVAEAAGHGHVAPATVPPLHHK